MFAESNRELLRRLSDLTAARDPIEALRGRTLGLFLAFCVEDPGRYQAALFQRTIPWIRAQPGSLPRAGVGYVLAKRRA